ncbi:hypothetical protein HMPREF0063_11996 [Aeromicrobium marinum DSM 15272]|uniref:ABC transporter permease n=1 Tax=Aeromicrobium marinum DSM 15272 TaxID=585531 RepID=E2SE60_9ACTN|nr:ABC transporter permease [Aeromicrobium marinum]EFQ82787.1 hypothetical protein HMPREF0063_11996 [Aeromicrobium marinum DSM 15272]
MSAALRAEVRKFFSTRLWWILLVVMMAYLAFIAGVMAFSLTVGGSSTGFAPSAELGGEETARTVYSLTSAIGYVFPLVIGSLAFTGEFRHQTITPSLLVEPRRSVLLGAKLVASVGIGLLYGIAGTAMVVAVGAPILAWQGDGAYLGTADSLELIGLSVIVMMLWAVMGVAFGGLLTNQIAAIVVVLAFTQFVEPIARVALGAFESTSGVAQYLPGAAADAIQGASFYSAMNGSTDLLPQWAGGLLMLGYIVVLAALARVVTLRRDIG